MLIDGGIIGALGLIGYFGLKGNKKKMATAKHGKTLGQYEGLKGIKVSRNHCIKTEKIYEGILAIASPGEGKTTCTILNNLLGNHLPVCSKILFDPKGEIHDFVAAYRASLGEENLVYEPLGDGIHYNPLDFCRDFTDIRDLAYILLLNSTKGVKDETWINMSMPLLTACLLYATIKGGEYKTITYALETLICNNDEKLEVLFEETGDVQLSQQFAIYTTASKSDGTVGSIKSTIATSLALFTDPKIVKSTSFSDFTFEELRDRNKTINIFVKYDIDKSNYLGGLLAAFFTQMVSRLIGCYDEASSKKVIIFADELQNLGKIPNLKDYLAYMRYARIGILGCIQTISSLYDIYGKYAADSILGCFKTKVIFPGNSDPAVLGIFSSLSGEAEINIEQNMKTQKTKKVFYTGDEIRRLPDHHVLIICGNQYFLLDRSDYWKDSKEYLKNQEVS